MLFRQLWLPFSKKFRRGALSEFLFVRIAQANHSEHGSAMTAQRKNENAACFNGVDLEPVGYFVTVIFA